MAPDALALAAIMAQPFEPMVLSGAVTSQQLRSNLRALELCDQLKAGRHVVVLHFRRVPQFGIAKLW